ncbi:MAG TPA: hypothetical protein VJY40_03155, partial [Corynebacterium sp.]|nr:hypothetical protein [Corynebacterium sp.]
MADYIRELLAGELRRRAPHVVTNPEDFYVYCLADELAAEGHETTRTVPADELDTRIRANTLKAAEDYPDDLDVGDVLEVAGGFSVVTPTGRWHLTEGQAAELVDTLSAGLRRQRDHHHPSGEEMTPNMKNVPAPAATGVEDNKSIAERSVTTAYLSRWGHNTRDHFGTWEGVKIPKEDFIPVLVPVHVAQEMVAYGPQAVTINEGCVAAQSEHARAAAEEKRRVRLNNERAVIVKGAEADITYSVELLDAMGTEEWTPQLEKDARELLEEILDRPVDEVTAGLLTECRRVRRQQRD